MNKSLFKDFSIVQSIFEFVYYPVEDIHRIVSDFENQLVSIFEKKATETMVPRNAPPTVPRFILAGKNRVLEVGPINAVYKSDLEKLPFDQAIKLTQDKTKKIFEFLKSRADKIVIEGFNTTNLIQYPLKDISYPIENDIFDKFFRIERPVDFKSVSFSIMRKKDYYTFNNVIDVYEIRDITIDKKSEGLTRIPLSMFAVSERGLLNKIIIKRDIENEGSNRNISDPFNEILRITEDKIRNHADGFIFSEG